MKSQPQPDFEAGPADLNAVDIVASAEAEALRIETEARRDAFMLYTGAREDAERLLLEARWEARRIIEEARKSVSVFPAVDQPVSVELTPADIGVGPGDLVGLPRVDDPGIREALQAVGQMRAVVGAT